MNDCGCRKIKQGEIVPDYARDSAKKLANDERKPVCVIHCSDWDFCTLETIGNREIIEIITPCEP